MSENFNIKNFLLQNGWTFIGKCGCVPNWEYYSNTSYPNVLIKHYLNTFKIGLYENGNPKSFHMNKFFPQGNEKTFQNAYEYWVVGNRILPK